MDVMRLHSSSDTHYRELAEVYMALDQMVFSPAGYPAPELSVTHGGGWFAKGYGSMSPPDLAFLHQDQMFRWVALQVALFHSRAQHSRYIGRFTIEILSMYGIEARRGKVSRRYIPPGEIRPASLLGRFTSGARQYRWWVPVTRNTEAVLEKRGQERRERLAALPSCPVIPLTAGEPGRGPVRRPPNS